MQTRIRNFIVCKAAKIEVLHRYWERRERAVRKLIDDKEKRAAKRAQERILRRQLGGDLDVEGKWEILNIQVHTFMTRVENVQQKYITMADIQSKQLSGEHYDKKNISKGGGNKHNNSNSTNEANRQKDGDINFILDDSVDFNVRNKIIRENLAYKRNTHLKFQNLLIEKVRQRFNRGSIDEDLAREFLLCDSKDEVTQFRIANTQLNVIHNSKRIRLLRAPNHFLFLTNPKLGKVWRTIVDETVRADLVARKEARDKQTMDRSINSRQTVSAMKSVMRARSRVPPSVPIVPTGSGTGPGVRSIAAKNRNKNQIGMNNNYNTVVMNNDTINGNVLQNVDKDTDKTRFNIPNPREFATDKKEFRILESVVVHENNRFDNENAASDDEIFECDTNISDRSPEESVGDSATPHPPVMPPPSKRSGRNNSNNLNSSPRNSNTVKIIA